MCYFHILITIVSNFFQSNTKLYYKGLKRFKRMLEELVLKLHAFQRYALRHHGYCTNTMVNTPNKKFGYLYLFKKQKVFSRGYAKCFSALLLSYHTLQELSNELLFIIHDSRHMVKSIRGTFKDFNKDLSYTPRGTGQEKNNGPPCLNQLPYLTHFPSNF